MLEDGFFDPAKSVQIRRGDLPHWRQDGGLYFVTFRLSDSLPQVLLEKWKREKEELRRLERGNAESLIHRTLEQRRRIERWLDQGYGSCVLSDLTAKQIVVDTIHRFDGDRYELGDYAIAANHVHALLRTTLEVDLSEVLYSWKRFSSAEMLRIASVRKAFDGFRHLWQTESFDHIVRNAQSLEKIRVYIRGHDALRSRARP